MQEMLFILHALLVFKKQQYSLIRIRRNVELITLLIKVFSALIIFCHIHLARKTGRGNSYILWAGSLIIMIEYVVQSFTPSPDLRPAMMPML
jgi:hypothetical protein